MNKSKIPYVTHTWNVVTGRNSFSLKLHPERLDDPYKLRKPAKIFVCSMSDLFYDDVTDGFIQSVFTTMANSRQHTFLILTKRPTRMLGILAHWESIGLLLRSGFGCVLPNVWLGVSIENQRTADERIPLLLQTPATKRFISYEPALKAINIDKYINEKVMSYCGPITRKL